MTKEENVVSAVVNGSATLTFEGYNLCEPNSMITLKRSYLNIYEPTLMNQIKSRVGRAINIIEVRINSHGEVRKKEVTGMVKGVMDKSFLFSTKEDIDGTYEDGHCVLIRTDNPLGIVPLPLSAPSEFIPYQYCKRKGISEYLAFLSAARKIARPVAGKQNKTTLCYYSGDGKTETVDCNIRKVNFSNFEIDQSRITKFRNGELFSCEVLSSKNPTKKVKLHVTPGRYLYKITTTEGEEHSFTGIDDFGEN